MRPEAFLGVLMLETRFPRPPGDIGNALSFDFPVRYRVVQAASPKRVVQEQAHGLLPAFHATARALVEEGAVALTTSCGFLALHQRELAAAVDVPFATSSLLQLPTLQALYGPAAVGVLTIDATNLGAGHLAAVGAAPSTPVEGVAGDSEFSRCILGDAVEMDLEQARRDVVAGALRLRQRTPGLRAIVLECTNMPPYADAVAAATNCAVYDILTLCRQLWHAMRRAGDKDTTRHP